MRRPCHICVLWSMLFSCCELLSARQYSFELFGRENGLTNLSVATVYQDRAGFLWTGTNNGLFRYDGERFTRFGTAEGLPADVIETISESPKGELWVATRVGLARLSGERFERVDLGGAFAFYGPDTITFDHRGQLFAVTDRGLLIGSQHPGQPWRFQLAAVSGASSGIELDGENVWFGCAKRVCVFNNGATRTLTPEGIASEHWTSIARDRRGVLWFRGKDRLVHFNKATGHFLKDAHEPSAVGAGSMSWDHNGRFLIPSQDGLHIGNASGKWEIINAQAGLPGDVVLTAFEDREGSLWIGMRGKGLARWRGYGVWEGWGRRDGFRSEVIWDLARDSKGRIWAGTERGLHRLSNGVWQSWPPRRHPGLDKYFETMSVALGEGESIWVGNFNGGLFEIGTESGSVRQLGPADLKVNNLMIDSQKRLWVSARHGLFHGNQTGRPTALLPETLPVPPKTIIFASLEDAVGRLWAASSAGLLLREGSHWRRFTVDDGLADNAIHGLTKDPDGAIWLRYVEPRGLTKVRVSDAGISVHHITKRDGIPADRVYFTGFDSDRAQWVGTDDGVAVLRAGKWRHFNYQDGLASNDVNGNSFLSDSGGVWIGTVRGLSRYFHRESPRESAEPNVLVTDLSFGGLPSPTAAWHEVPFSSRSFAARFVGLTYNNSAGILFRYRLNTDREWTETTRKSLQIDDLTPGDYQLQVLVRSALGVWSPRPAEYSFRILRPWYLRWWAITGWAAIVFALSRFVMRWREQRMVAEQQRLEQLVKVRTRDLEEAKVRAEESNRIKSEFLANMSHEIRTPMNGIIGLTELLHESPIDDDQRESLGMIRTSADSLMEILNDILDVSKIEAGLMRIEEINFSFRELADAAIKPLSVVARRKKLDIRWSVADEVPASLIGDPFRLRQIMVNLIGNAVKFTEKGHIALTVSVANTFQNRALLMIRVEDTGMGIPASVQRKIFEAFSQADGSMARRHGGTGLGLTICAKLAGLMGGEIGVESEPGVGSTFWFTVNVRIPSQNQIDTLDAANHLPCAIL